MPVLIIVQNLISERYNESYLIFNRFYLDEPRIGIKLWNSHCEKCVKYVIENISIKYILFFTELIARARANRFWYGTDR